MDITELKAIWAEKYNTVPEQLLKLKEIPAASTAFNTNIDAIIKISGKKIQNLLEQNKIPAEELENITLSRFRKPEDVLIGVVKCFSQGIAEEWVAEDRAVYLWVEKELGYDRMQMGGQAGIIANALALLGIKQVIVHTNSHPELQSKQFLDLDNLYGFDEDGKLQKASDIVRKLDNPLIHWIIEFDKGDSFTYEGLSFSCPKSNRFIVTYDPLNMKLSVNQNFSLYLEKYKVPYLLLSGFHPLLENNDGLQRIRDVIPEIQLWKQQNREMITHLEVASTQDKVIRRAIMHQVAPLAESIGLNERETIDVLEIFGREELYQRTLKEPNSCNLCDALLFIKEQLNAKRIQLHMFGLYLTIQDEHFPFTPEQNIKGMMTAAVVSSSKAFNGELTKYEDVSKTLGQPVSDQGLKELTALAEKLGKPELLTTGMCVVGKNIITAVPTILIDKPKTLVGMGDTISSVSLLAGR
jgi:ADP-dependent phosphofructokinase/glucokinase